MAVVRDPKHQRALAREFDIRQGFVSPELEPSIQPVTLVADLANRDELGDAPYFRKCIGYTLSQGDATHPPIIWLMNPLGSNTIITLRAISKLSYTGNIGPVLKLCDSTTTPVAQTNFPSFFRNTRIAGAPAGLLQTNQSSGAGGTGSNTLYVFLNSTFGANPILVELGAQPTLDIVLAPGRSVLLHGQDATAILTAIWFWEETPFDF